jgi:predicted nuclease of predicted toxin-antitoxin system
LKLLFDENLSHRLPHAVASEFPGSEHLRDVGLLGGTDEQIWSYAGTHGFVIVSKDTDFRDCAIACGGAPKVI